jgi:hypothetical protein
MTGCKNLNQSFTGDSSSGVLAEQCSIMMMGTANGQISVITIPLCLSSKFWLGIVPDRFSCITYLVFV